MPPPDRIFKHLPNEVRGPIIAAWGVRGIKSALRDNDEKVQSVVHDALVAGDIDAATFEEGLSAETLARWVPLTELWAFWRGGKLSKHALQKALSTAYDFGLFDARWFLETVQSRNGTLKGTDVLADGLSKDELVAWVKKIHETGDGSPKGMVAALGWDKITARTRDEALLAVLDSVATKAGLAAQPAPKEKEAAAPAAAPGGPAPAAGPSTSTEGKNEGAAPVDAGKGPKGAASSEKLPQAADDRGWESMRPGAPTAVPPAEASDAAAATAPEAAALSTEEAINIVLEDELIIPEGMASTPAPAAEPPTSSGSKNVQRDPFAPRPASGKRA
jgi:hypothetical protein